MKLKFLQLALVCMVCLSAKSCVKNNNLVPYVHVDLYLNLYLPSYSSLNAIGGWAYVSGGSRGIIVYRQSSELFATYDRHCTFNADNPCGIAELDSTFTFVECACDGSEYQLYDGLVIQGPATFSLKPYRSTYNSMNNTLHIYN